MTKKTRRKLPPGQRPRSGAAAGYEQHGTLCTCRQCRRLAELGRSRNPDMTVRQMITDHVSEDVLLDPPGPAGVVLAARQLAQSMEHLHASITQVAAASGKYYALLANEQGAQTLATIEGDQVFQLMGSLDAAYKALADYIVKTAEEGS